MPSSDGAPPQDVTAQISPGTPPQDQPLESSDPASQESVSAPRKKRQGGLNISTGPEDLDCATGHQTTAASPSEGRERGPTDEVEEPASPKFGDLGDYWKHLDEEIQQKSDDLAMGLKATLDNLLIFVSPHY